VIIGDMSNRSRGRMVALAMVAAALVVVGCGDGGDDEPASPDTTEESSGLSGYTREPTPSVADVQLPLVDGAGDLPAAAAPGGLRVVYFGYTSCPDVCPTTMSDLKRALAQLPAEDAERVEVVMVTIDPDRDVDEKLGAYVGTFLEDGQASRITDPAALQAAADAFGASYAVKTAEDGEIEVSHSADLYVVDDNGDIVLQWPFGTTYEDIADDLSALLADRASA
jgi:protein SCO1/2